MKAHALVMFGSLLVAATACHIDVDDYCDDGDHDWDDDDDGQPCETHVHADTTATSTQGVAGTSASGASSGDNAGGVGGEGGVSNGTDSVGGAGAGAADAGSDGSGGAAGSGTTAGSACTACGDPPAGSACLWGTTTMDSCCSVEVLVDLAASECDAHGLELADYRLEAACSTGHQQVSYQCCLADAGGCEPNSITLESCVGESILATMAQQLCEATGSSAMQLTLAEACDSGSYRAADFACCPAD